MHFFSSARLKSLWSRRRDNTKENMHAIAQVLKLVNNISVSCTRGYDEEKKEVKKQKIHNSSYKITHIDISFFLVTS